MISDRPAILNRKSGLSLIELLISLALMAIIALGITSSLGLASRVYERSKALVPQSDPVIYRLHLRRWLATAISPSLLTPFPVRFDGTSSSMEFVTLTETPYALQAAATRVEIAVQEGKLILVTTALADDGSEIDTAEQVLADNMSNASISYLDSDPAPMDWRTEWTSQTALPRAVKITADPGSSPDWPDLIVQLIYAPPSQ